MPVLTDHIQCAAPPVASIHVCMVWNFVIMHLTKQGHAATLGKSLKHLAAFESPD